MKKLIVTGMVLLSTSFAAAAGAKSVSTSPRELLTEYTERIRQTLFKGGKTAADIDSQTRDAAKKELVNQLGMPEVRGVMSGEAGNIRMDQLLTIVAAKKLGAELAKSQDKAVAEDGESIVAAAKANARFLANERLLKATKDDSNIKELKTDEITLVRAGIKKAGDLTADTLLKFSKAERESYTKVFEKWDELNNTSGKSAEENFVQAIMDVKGVSKEKALEIIRKLKEC